MSRAGEPPDHPPAEHARHVPDRIIQVAAIPATLTGKKVEVPVRRIG